MKCDVFLRSVREVEMRYRISESADDQDTPICCTMCERPIEECICLMDSDTSDPLPEGWEERD
jgi:hypothetical protein